MKSLTEFKKIGDLLIILFGSRFQKYGFEISNALPNFFSILQQRQQQGGGPGLRIASVSSLQKPQKQSPVSLPSSISISRVQNEQQAPQVRQVQQRLPPGTMISGQRPGPRGAGPGMGAGPRGGMRPGMGMMGRGMAPGGQRMPYMNGGGGVKRPGGAVNPGLATN